MQRRTPDVLASGPILVPLDGSPLSERSLPYATAVSRAFDARLVLMIAAYVSDIPGHGPWSDEMVSHPYETCSAYLADAKERVAYSDIATLVKVGYPHETILEAAAEVSASLIVLSTHGRSGFGRWVYGSTAGHLLHASKVPLLVVGKDVPDRGETPFAPAHVLVPLDGSAPGEAAIPHAVDIARAFGATITLIRVAPFSVEAYPMAVPQAYWPGLDEELVASATAYVEKVRERLDVPVEVAVMQGARADALLGFVETHGVDLVVMTTHGRAGISRAVLGSTADRMLQGGAPVLLIRPEEPVAR
jgi:nucleotide-binding universal stress UspA family protein